jgi:hypothetical protein
MYRGIAHGLLRISRHPGALRLLVLLGILSGLAACSSHQAHHARSHYNPSRYYPPPGSPSDPWGPYIHEASGRFGVPELWVRRVMRQESGGQQDVISWAGAMGLMQVMPDTYDDLRGRYDLGDDPFDPHNNILAGTAYLREMYNRFGAPGFLAAYNAGPNRLDRYLRNGTPLPQETVSYVASIAPYLGSDAPMSGPLAVYAARTSRFAARSTPGGCDPDAAYNPNGPCTPLIRPAVVATSTPQGPCDPDAAYNPSGPCTLLVRPAVVAAIEASRPQGPCDPDAAYNPNQPCTPPRSAAIQPTIIAAAAPSYPLGPCDPDAAYDLTRPCQREPTAAPSVAVQPEPRRPEYAAATRRPLQEMIGQRVAFSPGSLPERWAIQVGAFANLATAQAAAENARAAAPDLLRMAKVELPATTPFGSQVAFRARLSGLSPAAAADACARLGGRGIACITVPPSRGSF